MGIFKKRDGEDSEQFTITWDSNGGSVVEQSTYDPGSELGANLPEPTRKGYVFKWWWTDPEEGNPVVSETIVTQNATYYAHWDVDMDNYDNMEEPDDSSPTIDPSESELISSDASKLEIVVRQYRPIPKEHAIDVPDGAYAYRTLASALELPYGRKIGNRSFQMCVGLENICLPVVEWIGDNAFNGCFNSVSIAIPKARHIGNEAFSGCTSARNVEMECAQVIGNGAFRKCKNLQGQRLKESNDGTPTPHSIGESAFEECENMEFFHGRANPVGKHAFKDCKNLEYAILRGTKKLNEGVFKDCKNLKLIEIPSATSINKTSFLGCENVKLVNIWGVDTQKLPEKIFEDMAELNWLNLQNTGLTKGDITKDFRDSIGLNSKCHIIVKNGIAFGKVDGVEIDEENEYEKLALLDNLYYQEEEGAEDWHGYAMEVKDLSGIEMLVDGFAKGIMSGVFIGCDELKFVFMPRITGANQQDCIGIQAFKDCRSLKYACFPKLRARNASIGAEAFIGCPLEYLVLGRTSIDAIQENASSWGIASGCVVVGEDGTYVVP